LRWFNRWFGGLPTVRDLIADALCDRSDRRISILDVASGNGYIAQQMEQEFSNKGVRLEFALLDRSAAHLPSNGSMAKVAAEAVKLPFRNSSFDFVLTSLFVHHLAPEGVLTFAREALRVCRSAVLVHDLIRHPLHLAIAYAGVPLYRSRLTRNDAPASVWQAYTVDEMRDLFQQAGAASVRIKTHYLYRMGVAAWKQAPR
jgi:ubiquinone/menaquinone biosynthesis C-methylase UbiE